MAKGDYKMMSFFSALLNLFAKPEPDPEVLEANQYARAIIAELNRKGICYVRKYKDGGQELETVNFGKKLRFLPDRVELEVAKVPYGWDYKDLKKPEVLENLSTALRREVEVRHGKGEGFVFVVRRFKINAKANFKFTDLKPPASYNAKKTPLFIPIGRDENGRQIWDDLALFPHCLVGGTTGGGKSFETHGVLCWVISNADPQDVQMVIVDLKDGVEFKRYTGIPHLLFPVAYDHDSAYERLMWINQEIERRAELFRTYDANNLDTYLIRSGKFLPRVLFVIEEFANIAMFQDEEKREWAYRFIKDGAQRARSFGIHFWAVTQRPSVKIIDGDTRMNFPTRLAFRMASDIDSRVILGNDLAAQGLTIGDFIYQSEKYRDILLRGIYFAEDSHGDNMAQIDQIIEMVKIKHQSKASKEEQQQGAEARRREALIQRMLDYAQNELGGSFHIKQIHQKFNSEIALHAVNDLAKELEIEGKLSPARGSIPRQIVSQASQIVSHDPEMLEIQLPT